VVGRQRASAAPRPVGRTAGRQGARRWSAVSGERPSGHSSHGPWSLGGVVARGLTSRTSRRRCSKRLRSPRKLCQVEPAPLEPP
jgi:hypothetical protein